MASEKQSLMDVREPHRNDAAIAAAADDCNSNDPLAEEVFWNHVSHCAHYLSRATKPANDSPAGLN